MVITAAKRILAVVEIRVPSDKLLFMDVNIATKMKLPKKKREEFLNLSVNFVIGNSLFKMIKTKSDKIKIAVEIGSAALFSSKTNLRELKQA
jgi:hypothetical protein